MDEFLTLKDNILDFKLSTTQEICQTLGQRLKQQRLLKRLKQQELAARAGVSLGTIKNLEAKGQSSLETLIRIVAALDLVSEMEKLFTLKLQSIAQMEKIEKLFRQKRPQRVR